MRVSKESDSRFGVLLEWCLRSEGNLNVSDEDEEDNEQGKEGKCQR